MKKYYVFCNKFKSIIFFKKLIIGFAENAIALIKRRLYATLRSNLSKDWVHYLKPTVENLNLRHVKSLGGFQPKNANSLLDDVKIREAQREKGIIPYKDPPLKEQLENEKKFNKDKKNQFSVDSYVYLDSRSTLFGKSFDMQISKFKFII